MMDERTRIAMDAAMEGEATAVRGIGGMVKVSAMELIVLCNMARLACFEEIGKRLDDEALLAENQVAKEEFVEGLDEQFRKGDTDGVYRLMTSCIAMLGQERFEKYLV